MNRDKYSVGNILVGFFEFWFVSMTEASLYFDGDMFGGEEDAPGVCRSSEFRATPSSLAQSENRGFKNNQHGRAQVAEA